VGGAGSPATQSAHGKAGATCPGRIRNATGNVTRHRLNLTRAQILAYRRTVQALRGRLPAGSDSLRQAAWAGIQDSMPRAALFSIHARVEGTEPSTWEDPSLVQLWGPRFSTYLVAARDRAVFTLSRLPDDARGLRVATETAANLRDFLAGRRMGDGQAGHALGVHPNSFRYAAPTGTVLIRWDGARQPTIWTVEPPRVDPAQARLELARRYLHTWGPTTAMAFAQWAGIGPAQGQAAFNALASSLVPVRTPIGEASILSEDEPGLRASPGPEAPARLLPSGDTYFLLQGADREVLVPEADRRSALWTSRVWPGAVLVGGAVVGTWRRAAATISIQAWRRLTAGERTAIESEAATLPLPDLRGRILVRWVD